jgi:dipeptide/tripeptide permease
MSLGGDTAPKEDPGPFLGMYKLLNEIGSFLGPLMAGLVTQWAGSARFASAAFMGTGLLAALWVLLMVTETGGPRLAKRLADEEEKTKSIEGPCIVASTAVTPVTAIEHVSLTVQEGRDNDRRASG